MSDSSIAVAASPADATATTWEACIGPATWLREPLQRTLRYPNPLPVQQAVIPTITRALLGGVPNDVSLTAPTGSGKTLCYLLPLLRLLTETKRGVDDNALRCLILVPTQSLGQQVHRELQRLTRPTSIRVACICTDASPEVNVAETDAEEAKELVRRVVLPRSRCSFSATHEDDHGSDALDEDADELYGGVEDVETVARNESRLIGNVSVGSMSHVRYFSNADVVVATPQRLLHHLDHTRGLRLADLRLLVIDEADQVLVGNFASQVQKVNARYEYEVAKQQQEQQRRQQRARETLLARMPATSSPSSSSSSTAYTAAVSDGDASYNFGAAHSASVLHKVLCSATLSSRIARISQVKLRNCSYYVLDSNGAERKEEAVVAAAAATTSTRSADGAAAVRTQFALPPTLQEHVLFVEDAYRPAVLLKLVHTLRERIAAVAKERRSEAARRRAADDETTQAHNDASQDGTAETTSAVNAGSSSAAAAAAEEYPTVEARAGTGILIFCATAEEARVMSHFLAAAGIAGVVEFTTLASEAERRRALLQRPSADVNTPDAVSCVVASDALMRGIDIPDVGHVIMYHPPDAVSQYVHRAGRTARAMRPGHVHLLLSKTGASGTQEDGEMALYKRLSQSLSRTLPVSYERLFFRFAEKPNRASAADGAAGTTSTAAPVAANKTAAAAASVGSAEWWVEQAGQFLVQSQHQLQRRWASVLESAAAVAAAAANTRTAKAVVAEAKKPAAPVISAGAHAASSRKRARPDAAKAPAASS